MGKKLELKAGDRFERLSVIREVEPIKRTDRRGHIRRVLCECSCPAKTIDVYRLPDLRSGRTLSCGCLKSERVSERCKAVVPFGTRFNRLTVLREVEPIKRADTGDFIRQFECLCDCDSVLVVRHPSLASGNTKSCGCLKSELLCERNFRHGHTSNNVFSTTYLSWVGMKSRCLNPNNKAYKHYGGRGITICDRWLNSFENFLADMGEREKGLTLERLNVDLGYFPENTIWATRLDQARNKRNNRLLTYDNKTDVMAVWAEKLNISIYTLSSRLNTLGWDEERALSTPVAKKLKS